MRHAGAEATELKWMWSPLFTTFTASAGDTILGSTLIVICLIVKFKSSQMTAKLIIFAVRRNIF
ncbi:hypothetical protein BN938_2417 [Mucinivorans hirudinis]|uniref:Uncharacterized protein n=1 Tax=Mucinivorans hirudinis TaxID=1433126 RepID=A0A060RA76_9BACT|nr:hypothetical protein BN938_2417 [Mucinivorans hirudinis]